MIDNEFLSPWRNHDVMKFCRNIAVLFALTGLACTSFAQTLTPGMKAPEFKATWIKGQPVKKFEKGRIYVIDFWATWCGFCIQGMPDLTKLSKKYADKATFIAMNVLEKPGNDDIAERVQNMVDELGEKMDVNVGRDEDGSIAKNWLIAAKFNGLPTSIVIDGEGNVAWIGHTPLLEPVLEELVAGKFDVQLFKKQYLAEIAINEELNQALGKLSDLRAKYEKTNSAETLIEMGKIAAPIWQTPDPMYQVLKLGLLKNNFSVAERMVRNAFVDRNKSIINILLDQDFSVLPKNEAAYKKLKEDTFQFAVKWVEEEKEEFYWQLGLAETAAKSNRIALAQKLMDEAKQRYEASSGKDERSQRYVDGRIEAIKKAIELAKKSGGGE